MKGHVFLLVFVTGLQLTAGSTPDFGTDEDISAWRHGYGDTDYSSVEIARMFGYGLEDEDSSEKVSAPDVYPCCSEGSKLRLTKLKNGGKSAECIKLTREEADKVETWTPNLNILEDTNLPPCQRGLLDVVVEVKGQESVTTTTTTTTTTAAPEESKLVFEMSFQTLQILH